MLKTSPYEKQIQEYNRRIDGIMREKNLMLKEIKNLKQKHLFKAELQGEKGKIAKRYGQIINQKVQA